MKFQEGCIKRKANEGRLRWLESDSNDSDEDTNSKNDVLSESKEKEDASEGPSASIEPLKFSLPTGLQPDEPNVEASSPSSQKSKKKKKKSKKQKRGKSRSKSSSPPTQSSATSTSLLQSGSQISFVGAFLPLNSNDISYVAINNVQKFTFTFDGRSNKMAKNVKLAEQPAAIQNQGIGQEEFEQMDCMFDKQHKYEQVYEKLMKLDV
ncbi:unnamed protein product [Bursaphelenchus okinawaensis]|uniref:Uncharacterized protein n=1 Tax=Bursaphelenchus okinawaensis TaxID=465554 RepID=A0A811LQE6_9BILA|nr:unnamed protein product [Bursaphelenchus okinawaensis]CAG9125719.1 unnamed protein product [Bursaphelenchus okinawaensis]